MKGFTHFISAAAVASTVPGAAEFAVENTSFIIVLGGVFGLLPDTLDFKLNKLIHNYDEIYEPEQMPNPTDVANAVARNIEKAWNEKRTVNLHLQTIKVGADLWREYNIWFEQDTREIVVRVGPVVTTGKVPQAGTEPEENSEGRAKVNCDFIQNYQARTSVSIFSGPSFGFVPRENHIEVQFIPWHRGWSHSLTVSLFFGLIAWGIAALYYQNWLYPGWMYCACITLGGWTHVIEDQFGHMGSNLLYPFTKNRASGFKTMHAGDALPNFLVVWLSVALLFWNMYRALPPSPFADIHISGIKYLVIIVIIPTVLLLGGWFWRRKYLAAQSTSDVDSAPPEESEEDSIEV